MADEPLRIGVLPATEHARRARLWSALQDAYPVRFEGRAAGAVRELDGIVALEPAAVTGVSGEAIPSLLAYGEELRTGPASVERDQRGPLRPEARRSEGRPETAGVLALARDAALARPLQGANLNDAHAVALRQCPGDERGVRVLATLDGAPAWVLTDDGAPRHRVGCAPTELGEGEALRERLRPGRCLSLLALAQFLEHLTDAARGEPSRGRSPLQAAFLIDDPNLHRPSYGHLRYRELLGHARAHGYHLTVAMVPLDGWFADPRVARMFREGARHLSVCVHGNEHEGPELARPSSTAQGLALGAQALRRMAAFQRRTGVAVDRVMVPPHEQISEPMARALGACGFEALCTTRPYPWMATSPQMPWLTRPPDAGPLAGWRPADVVAGGLPVLLRADFTLHPREDLVLRAFLGQPLILYGHHELLRHGPAPFADAAAAIGALGEVRWHSLAQIARALTATSTAGDPPAAEDTPARGGAPAADDAIANGGAPAIEPLAAIPAPPRRLRPILRRVAAESEVRVRTMLSSRGRS
jgi:hypothetical protein